ncbi:unnamed protein product [Cyclocybe aegerita]|uniref:[histone H3]-trimethyl-L-lysine(9) demethylase n=1 Tax=Cyclocybe aegerita TaxID=1973307 RepID=A0A8S0W412_CYCAE|nr:unnamed protein product [Cyclocybe aegerita]
MTSLSRASTLTPCSSPAPPGIPVQPDHFYGTENVQLPPSPNSDGKTYLDPADDPLAHRGIPVFKPTMEEFRDFEEYMNRVECWGMRSGIVKIIPPKEWTDSLPPLKEQLANVKIKTPIEQHMLGSGGLFRQENMEKRKLMSVREWAELCIKDEFRAPGVHDVGLSSRGANVPTTRPPRVARRTKQKSETVKAESTGPASNVITVKEEPTEDCHSLSEERTTQTIVTPPHSEVVPPSPAPTVTASKGKKTKKKQAPLERASLADRAARDRAFLEVFDPHQEWLPPNTKAADYTPEFCQTLERHYWRNCGLGKPAWYGADTQGSLFTNETRSWNVAHLKSALTRLLPSSSQGLPGVNTPYLYFGMWRATFAWHVEDMDLFSINYIHFGAPKFWYAVPQGRANALEQIMRGYFPKDTSQCPQFLRHKSFLASPSLLAKDSCRPNHMVQQAGEFVITYPRGYHAGFNLGFNCAESVNFALDSWLELGRKAKACECISDSVRIDVDELLKERAEEQNLPPPLVEEPPPAKPSKRSSPKKQIVKQEVQEENLPPIQPSKAPSRKRKSDASEEGPKPKKIKFKAPSKASTSVAGPSTSTGRSTSKHLPKVSVTLKLGPRPAEPESLPCCLCVSTSEEGLLRVQDPPVKKDAIEGASHPKVWMAHELCAKIVPETWVDDLLLPHGGSERVVYGVDAIVRDRWNLKCSACTKNRMKGHGAPVQCTKGKCPKAFHVNCAKEGHAQGIVFSVVRDVEKEVVLYNTPPPTAAACASANLYEMPVESDPSTFTGDPADFYAMAVDGQLIGPTEHHNSMAADETTVLKVIKKLEVQILCTQHNPAVAAQKRASKQDKIRQDLLALPSMARIKIRVSAGVFEVSLIRVIEETGSVEVLWDRGTKREFKWGSVVFGTTDGPVQQKPSDILAYAEQEQIHLQHQQQHQQQERPPSVLPVNTFPSVSAATAQRHSYNQTSYALIAPAPSSSAMPLNRSTSSSSTTPATQPATNLNHQAYGNRTAYTIPARTGSYDYWAYASAAAAAQYNSQAYGYPYSGYYASAGNSTSAVGSKHYNPYAYAQAYAAHSSAHAQAYRTGAGAGQPLNWQQPYQGPPQLQSQTHPQQQMQGLAQAQGSSLGVAAVRTSSEAGHASESSQAPHESGTQASSSSSFRRDASQQVTTPPFVDGAKSTPQSTTPSDEQSQGRLEMNTATEPASAGASTVHSPNTVVALGAQVSSYQDLATLASLPPTQIADILRANPQLREMVMAAVDQVKKTEANP